MPTLVRDPPPPEFVALLHRRQHLGQDLYDETWEGVLHMNPAPSGRHGKIQMQLALLLGPLAQSVGLLIIGPFNLGQQDDYRVPDAGLLQDSTDRAFYPTAALAIEIVSPGDESWAKLAFYAAHGVAEVLIVDPQERTVSWLGLEGDDYQRRERSTLIELGAADLAAQLSWA
jgi:Uma2 family endonuclease